MTVGLGITSNLEEIARRLGRIREASDAVVHQQVAELAHEISGAWEPLVAAMTPVDTGTLLHSTRAEETVLGDEAEVRIIQDAENRQGTHYGRFVAYGHWVVGGPGRTTRLYFWDGYHYPEDAWEMAMPAVEAMLDESAIGAATEIAAVFHGRGGGSLLF